MLHILFLTDWKGDLFLFLAMARNLLELLTSVSVTRSRSPLMASRHNTNWYRPFFFTSFFFLSRRFRTSAMEKLDGQDLKGVLKKRNT